MICTCGIHVHKVRRAYAMQKRTLWLSILISTLLTLILTACGSTSPATTQPGSSAASTKESLYVVDGSLSSANVYTGQRIVEFHPGSTTQPVVLPAGLYSMDHKNIYTATPQNGQTTITVTNAQTGVTTRTFSIPGNYTTSGEAYTSSVLSANGRWLALRQQGGTNTQSTIVLVDTQAGKLAKTIQLPGDYDLDAISADGTALYAANGALGVVTSISLSGEQVFNDNIIKTSHFNPGNVTTRDKSAVLYNGAALSPDQNTLYFVGVHGIWAVNTHDLNVKENYATQQAFTGIALGNNGQTLYAVYPTNGITMVNVASGQSQRVTQSPAHTPWGIACIAPN